jgi:hypothetical protein
VSVLAWGPSESQSQVLVNGYLCIGISIRSVNRLFLGSKGLEGERAEVAEGDAASP